MADAQPYPCKGQHRFPSIRRDSHGCFKHVVIAVVVLIAFLFSALVHFAPRSFSADFHHGFVAAETTNRSSVFSFDADGSHHPSWMAEVPDETNLTSLSIPGTHDTMTHRLNYTKKLWCQNHELEVQLDAGIRYLDIRLRLRDDALAIYHGTGDTGYLFPDVLRIMDGFLEEHSSEALVVRVKDEGYPLGNNQLTFAEAFDRDIKNTRRIRPFDARHPLPSLGELRGSIFLLQEFKSSHLYGLEWDGTHMTLEDWWIVPDLSFLPIKWDKIRAALELAATKPLDNSSLYLAHVSATGERLMPVNAAAGPTDRSVGGLNDRTGHWLEDQCGAFPQPRVGIVIMDFPGWRAIDAVLAWNEALRQSRGVDDLEQRCLLKRDV